MFKCDDNIIPKSERGNNRGALEFIPSVERSGLMEENGE